MKRTKNKLLLVAVWLACILLIAANGLAVGRASASAAHYCDDGFYEGSGSSTSANYTIEYDSYVEYNDYRVTCAPSLHDGGAGTTNACTAIAGLNVMAFYDRYYTNLIPNHEPGIEFQGKYRYLPNLDSVEIQDLFLTLYDYMQVNVSAPGATETDFKNGLTRYVNEQGYNVSYNSMYKNATTVNLTKVQQMVNNKRVGVLFLSGYNFVYGFDVEENSRTVYRSVYTSGHVMMVYGYFTVDYYKNGSKFLTETYLCASSCNSFADAGFIKMDDNLTIDDAIIVQIG